MNEQDLRELIETFYQKWTETDGLWRNDYYPNLGQGYREYRIKVSFGQGVRIAHPNQPWIAFLKYDQEVQQGIYPIVTIDENGLLHVHIGESVNNPPLLNRDCIDQIKHKTGFRQFTIDEVDRLIIFLNEIMNIFDQEMESCHKEKIEPSIMSVRPINNNIKNIILYGPPGVGKTHSINKLIQLIEKCKTDKEIFDAIQNNELNEMHLVDSIKERTAFVTFHQSFGYEDFIEGFRPNEEGNIELIDGIFKQLAEIANDNLLQSQNEQDFDFDNLLYEFVQSVEANQGMEIGDGITIQVKKKSNGDFQSFVTTGNVKGQSLTKNIIKRDFEKYLKGEIRKYQDIKPTYESKSSYHGNAPYYFKLYEKMKSFMEEAGHSFIKESESQKNYYLIIDEINRGNISKIFGELITLIEEDKRDKLEVKLPYSKEPFKVPSNLYIIGTMNSTDKSIALIDIALRRRFTFLKMEPNSDLIDNKNARQIFADLNEYITDRLGENYRIGHSYFMGKDINLDFVLEYKIKPLLEEYFYGDKDGLDGALEKIRYNIPTINESNNDES